MPLQLQRIASRYFMSEHFLTIEGLEDSMLRSCDMPMTDAGTRNPSPLAIVDVHYDHAGARAACVVASNWTVSTPLEEHVVHIPSVLPYVPGRFFERELPCIVEVLSLVRSDFEAIVVDGYVHLDSSGTAGLGSHLYAHYGGQYAVVGVAKTAYRAATSQ